MYKSSVPNSGAMKGFVIAVIVSIVLCLAIVAPFVYTAWLGG